MKPLFTWLALCAFAITNAQGLKYYRPGQKFINDDGACLVIKNDLRLLLHAENLEQYKETKSVKLVGFHDLPFDLDSLLTYIDDFTAIKRIIIERCDLSMLTQPLDKLSSLEEIYLVNNSGFLESAFFPLVKNCPVKNIFIQMPDEELVTDSLALLPQLRSIHISNSKRFTIPNQTNTFRYTFNGKPHDYSISYYGDLRKTKPVARTKHAQPNGTAPYKCIRQPIPGVNINDTTFFLSSASGSTFFYNSGSRISIGRNSFVSQDGKKYDGCVNVFYREFRNPVEIMLSGIPMSNKAGGQTRLFKSGGMYEISATDYKGRPLKTVSDTSIKINFVLSDTSENFSFYSLNSDGSWAIVSNKVNIIKPAVKADTFATATRAIREFMNYLMTAPRHKADTTAYSDRFDDDDYLYVYRKDNLSRRPDSGYVIGDAYHRLWMFGRVSRPTKGLFKIKYLRQTKEKEIIYTLVPATPHVTLPAHIRDLMNRTFVYNGELSKNEFRETYCRKVYFWDARPSGSGSSIDLDLKTSRKCMRLSGQLVSQRRDKSYAVYKKASKTLNKRMMGSMSREAKYFNRTERFNYCHHNDVVAPANNDRAKKAYEYSKKFQNNNELQMDFKAWVKYVQKTGVFWNQNSFIEETQVGTALVKSGLGIKNIDCYLHSGQMQEIYVNYKTSGEDVQGDYNVMLYKSINTSYPLAASISEKGLQGYLFKNHPNYVIRFSEDGFMQVTKPEVLRNALSGSNIELNYTEGYNVKNLSSDEITKLILD